MVSPALPPRTKISGVFISNERLEVFSQICVHSEEFLGYPRLLSVLEQYYAGQSIQL